MNKLKEKYYIALGNLQSMAIDNTKGSKGVNICVLDINEYVAYLQSKIDKAIEYVKDNLPERDYMGCLLDEDVTLNRILEKLLDILKEDK